MNSVVLRQINAVSHIGEPWYVILDFDVWDKPLLLNRILYMSPLSYKRLAMGYKL